MRWEIIYGFYCKFPSLSSGGRILKISWDLTKLPPWIWWHLFGTQCISLDVLRHFSQSMCSLPLSHTLDWPALLAYLFPSILNTCLAHKTTLSTCMLIFYMFAWALSLSLQALVTLSFKDLSCDVLLLASLQPVLNVIGQVFFYIIGLQLWLQLTHSIYTMLTANFIVHTLWYTSTIPLIGLLICKLQRQIANTFSDQPYTNSDGNFFLVAASLPLLLY